MKSMIHAIWVWWKGSPVIANASGRSLIIAVNAVSNSMRGPTLIEITDTPNRGAARCSSSNWRTLEALSGFQRKATRETVGITSLRICSRLAPTSGPRTLLPVIFPPGRARLGTSPARTGSPIEIITTRFPMEHSMRAMRRTIALAFVLLGLASAPLAAQANPPPPSNPPDVQPTGPQYQGPPLQAPQAQSPQPQGPQYSSNEIVDAGQRFFGTISRELAQIVEKAGSQFGLPNGYVLGQEGGGAVVAGLRYGEGILYTKNAGDLRVFWQGPSVGYDFGVDGARTMMLVYNLPATDAIYQRFAGIEGSAYLVGGLGMTALTMNNIVVVPIRTGVGIRLGANVGYLKFTPTSTWNPF